MRIYYCEKRCRKIQNHEYTDEISWGFFQERIVWEGVFLSEGFPVMLFLESNIQERVFREREGVS